MKKVSFILMVVAMFCLICVPAFAVLDVINDESVSLNSDVENDIENRNSSEIDVENRNDNENRNTNTNLLGNDLDSRIENDVENDIENSNEIENELDQKQKQAMGQVAVGKVEVVDNSEYKSYSFAPPAIHAQKGTSSANMYSIFGGVGVSQTEEYTIAIEKLAVIERMEGLGYITKEEAIAEARQTFAELDSASQPKRVFGIFGKTRGRHLLNGLGLLAWDSFYKEGQKPFSKSEEWKKKDKAEIVEDTLDSVEGNRGNVNQ